MTLLFWDKAWAQYLHWQETDKATFRKLNALIRACLRHPFETTGKPAPLKGDLSGFWSRRITREHRLACRVTASAIEVVHCRYHH